MMEFGTIVPLPVHLARIAGLGCLGCFGGRRWPPSALGFGGSGGSAGVGGITLGGGLGGCGGKGAWIPVRVRLAGCAGLAGMPWYGATASDRNRILRRSACVISRNLTGGSLPGGI